MKKNLSIVKIGDKFVIVLNDKLSVIDICGINQTRHFAEFANVRLNLRNGTISLNQSYANIVDKAVRWCGEDHPKIIIV